MTIDTAIRGSLFAPDFLTQPESISELSEWGDLDDTTLDNVEIHLRAIFERFPCDGHPNESQTEDDLIWPTLNCLDWTATLRQQNLSSVGRTDVPDGLLFADDAAKSRAVGIKDGSAQYAIGVTMVESKRWLRPLDRTSDQIMAPSTQMLRYMRRADDLTKGLLRWGILTNGAQWRLYYQGARSVSEGFFEVDLAAILDIPGHNEGLFALTVEERRHCLKLFVILFGRKAFLAQQSDGLTLHQRVISQSRNYEERVADNLSKLVFDEVFPSLVHAIAEDATQAPLSEVRDAALILLYRLLFLLYAEDRALLPVADPRYDNIGLRHRVRHDIGRRKDHGETFSATATSYYTALDDLSRVIDRGDSAFGLPPYNGGLFNTSRTPLLTQIRLPNHIMADAIDALSFEQHSGTRRYINYRSLSVQQLGSIYERLLEFEIARKGGGIVVRPNIFARKSSGSYYTPESLVALILKETVGPLTDAKLEVFHNRISEIRDIGDGNQKTVTQEILDELASIDPAQALLNLKICDPAMGSGHFLVSLVDFLSDRVIAALAEADGVVKGYVSPLASRINHIRTTILENAKQSKWTVNLAQLDDRQIVRRMVLKRCVYGVDKNPMAVELAKVSLWLHTFTVGAPLSFLDHHLRCGDSLFGSWVHEGLQEAEGDLFLSEPLSRAKSAANPMHAIEALSDAEIAEAAQSSDLFNDIQAGTAPLDAVLSLLHAFDWLKPDKKQKAAIVFWLTGIYGDPIDIAMGHIEVRGKTADVRLFAELLARARSLAEEERFLNWQVAFPGVWTDWENTVRQGGFDAVIGNPPWDRIKLQQVEWFAARREEIALVQRASDRKQMIRELEEAEDPLAADYQHASERAIAMASMARHCGDYPYLSRGDVNLYSLFVERAMALVHSDGVVGLLTPSGIASDKTAAPFFRSVATEGRLRAFYDFENKKVFFADVHASFKFCVFVAGRQPKHQSANCAFYLHSVDELNGVDRQFPLAATDFARVNPNTGTAPIFRSRRDAEITMAIYNRLPVLVDRSSGEAVKAWPVKYQRMFDMTNDSHLFRTIDELEEREGAWPIGGNRFDSPKGEWVPLFVGRMIHQFDHRAASVEVNAKNLHNPAFSGVVTQAKKSEPDFMPIPQYWVAASNVSFPDGVHWAIAFRDIARATDVRTMIATAVPRIGLGNTLPAIFLENMDDPLLTALLLVNLDATVLDFVVRQKAQGTHLNWYIVEQLPVVPPNHFDSVCFGPKTSREIARDAVLELSYTTHDMAPFARDLGYVDESGEVKPPFSWDEDRRLYLRAKLDALFFHLYGITDRDDIRYIYSTFPIVERQEMTAYGHYRTRELCLAWMNALAAGRPDTELKG